MLPQVLWRTSPLCQRRDEPHRRVRNVLLYTPCTATFTVSPSLRGQVLAHQGIQGTHSFTLNFTQLANQALPETMGVPLPMVTVESKTARNG